METWHGLKVGDEIELEITGKARNGSGVGRYEGCIVFVEGATVGERVKAKVTKVSVRHVYAQVIRRLDQ